MDGASEIVFGFKVGRCQVAQTAGIGDSCANFWFADPHHGAADDGIFDVEHFGNFGLNHFSSLFTYWTQICTDL